MSCIFSNNFDIVFHFCFVDNTKKGIDCVKEQRILCNNVAKSCKDKFDENIENVQFFNLKHDIYIYNKSNERISSIERNERTLE